MKSKVYKLEEIREEGWKLWRQIVFSQAAAAAAAAATPTSATLSAQLIGIFLFFWLSGFQEMKKVICWVDPAVAVIAPPRGTLMELEMHV